MSAWKLFLLLPRLVLHRSSRGGIISKKTLQERFHRFARGEWLQVLAAGEEAAESCARQSEDPFQSVRVC